MVGQAQQPQPQGKSFANAVRRVSGALRRGDHSVVGFDEEESFASPSPKGAGSNGQKDGRGATPTSPNNSYSVADPLGDDLMGVPRKSFLLKGILSQQVVAFSPKYVKHKASLPPERWVRAESQSQWKSVPNPSCGTPDLTIPGYSPLPATLSWSMLSQGGGGDDASAHTDTQATPSPGAASRRQPSTAARTPSPLKLGNQHSLLSSKTPEPMSPPATPLRRATTTTAHSSQRSATRATPKSGKRPSLLCGTPLAHGVQQAWDSSYVQLGPFRDLVFYRHDASTDRTPKIPVDILPPSNVRLTPLEQHRVLHAQEEFLKERCTTPYKGHTNHEIARVTHIGLPDGFRKQTRSPSRAGVNSTGSAGGVGSPAASPGPGHPPMHFVLPAGPAIPFLPPYHGPSQLERRVLSTQRFRGYCKDHQNFNGGMGCLLCAEVQEDLDQFDAVREVKEERLYQNQLSIWSEEQAREEEAKNLPPDMMRTKSGRLVKRLIIMDEGPTVAQLYHGTTHEDREALYVSTCGGLSFDMSRERFGYLVQRVLAPRIHVRVTEEQCTAMFQQFDIDGNGSVSYLEYLSSLTNLMLSPAQKKLLEEVFEYLYRLPFFSGDARMATKQFQQHQIQMQMEGSTASLGVSTKAGPGGDAPSFGDAAATNSSITGVAAADDNNAVDTLRSHSPPSPTRKKSLSTLLRRKSSLRSLAETLMGVSPSGSNRGGANKEKPQNYLSCAHLTKERIRRVIYDRCKHNIWFPHPKNDALAAAIFKCFSSLQEDDRLNVHKFKMFIFCDERCMQALDELVPAD